jgi:hypothetical protein
LKRLYKWSTKTRSTVISPACPLSESDRTSSRDLHDPISGSSV